VPGPVPVVEITEVGLYVRMAPGRICARTVANGRWPHLAVDFDRSGRVIGIEAVPLPPSFNLHELARRAGVSLPALDGSRARFLLKMASVSNF
jgi:hypothetical protein